MIQNNNIEKLQTKNVDESEEEKKYDDNTESDHSDDEDDIDENFFKATVLKSTESIFNPREQIKIILLENQLQIVSSNDEKLSWNYSQQMLIKPSIKLEFRMQLRISTETYFVIDMEKDKDVQLFIHLLKEKMND